MKVPVACLVLLLAATTASAQSNEQPARQQAAAAAEAARAEVATGQDLVAWQTIEQRRLTGETAVAAYRGFLERYVGSPLAVMAWSRLVDLGAPIEAWMEDPQVKAALAPVRRAWEQAQRSIAALSPRRPVQMMEMGDAVADEDGARDTGR
ncbi:MAG TPA: hypothetical protein PKA64_06835 [Myxococcota bacterium]|nr:hypothetical protein [Myxococcota bacterium]